MPPLPLAALERVFLAGVADVYDGPVTIGVDRTFVSLPTGSTVIEVDEIL